MEELKKKIKSKKVILFVGAGVSKNVGLPDFSELINKMAENLSFDKDLFKLYGTNLALAEYYSIRKKGNLQVFRNRLEDMWNTDEIRENIRNSKIYDYIVNLNFDIIYTTNYDECLELAFDFRNKPYTKISNLKDLTGTSLEETQIIKYHGDIKSNRNDWVLTESSYFDRMSFEHPLDIKFRSDSLATSILFLGYSLADMNVRYLLYKLTKAWTYDGNHHKQPKSYIFLTAPNMVQDEILKSWGISPLFPSKMSEPGQALEYFLSSLI